MDAYFFDWGDTLMVDFPETPGKMCNWEIVEAVDGAEEALSFLSKTVRIYIVTGAADSSESEIRQAFARVGLDQFVSGYFCYSNTGYSKGSPEFLPTILKQLGFTASRVAMVGDSLRKDIEPAAQIGIQPIWLTTDGTSAPESTRFIRGLRELCK
ncbi:hydrolase [Salinivibrio kushneri]|uniref:HAD family hydrolase n=1 Tax=Salinivibrio kushneri TaxID=1908198 RepID=UPI000988F1C5|nr:HAD family hydrolase [Salinivibrio kushneri]OOE32202.1 hydrolase [Salinivibrio kushneri]